MRKHRGRGSVLDGVEGAVWSYEIKRGKGSGLWHPHLHMIALAEVAPDARLLSSEWHQITGDSYIVDVRPISQDDPASGFVDILDALYWVARVKTADSKYSPWCAIKVGAGAGGDPAGGGALPPAPEIFRS